MVTINLPMPSAEALSVSLAHFTEMAEDIREAAKAADAPQKTTEMLKEHLELELLHLKVVLLDAVVRDMQGS